jgi:hypothetical protein
VGLDKHFVFVEVADEGMGFCEVELGLGVRFREERTDVAQTVQTARRA